MAPQNLSKSDPNYHRDDRSGKLGETSDKLGPIVGNQAESSDRRATIRSRSGLSLTADGNSYCSFLLKNDLPSCKTSAHGHLSEPSPMKILGESSDTEAIHAHFCPNFHPNYHVPPRAL